MNKCLFFDIDGVLNKKSQWRVRYSLCDECIREFCDFTIRENAALIIMSTWRSGFEAADSIRNSPQIREVELRFHKYGVQITDKTPMLRGRTRDREIERYLYLHRDIQSFALVDDDPNEYGRKINGLYLVDCTKGFSAADAKRVKFVKRGAEYD